MNLVILDPGDSAVMTIDWSDVLAEGVTLSSVTHSVDSPLSIVSEAATTTTSSAKITGAVHGGLYMFAGAATLSNGEVINRQFPVRGWNS